MIINVDTRLPGFDTVSVRFDLTKAKTIMKKMEQAIASDANGVVLLLEEISVIEIIDIGAIDHAPSSDTLQ